VSLCSLCETKNGFANKTIVASCVDDAFIPFSSSFTTCICGNGGVLRYQFSKVTAFLGIEVPIAYGFMVWKNV